MIAWLGGVGYVRSSVLCMGGLFVLLSYGIYMRTFSVYNLSTGF
jgi:hypothetical protein